MLEAFVGFPHSRGKETKYENQISTLKHSAVYLYVVRQMKTKQIKRNHIAKQSFVKAFLNIYIKPSHVNIIYGNMKK